jgi:hypothetical protein
MGVEENSSLNTPIASKARSAAYVQILFVPQCGNPDGNSAHFGRVHLRSKLKLTAQMCIPGDCGMAFAVVMSRNALHPWVGSANQEAA